MRKRESERACTSCFLSYLAGGKKGIFLSIESFTCSFEGEALDLYVDLLQRICAQIHTTDTNTDTDRHQCILVALRRSLRLKDPTREQASLSRALPLTLSCTHTCTHTHSLSHTHTHTRTHKRTHARTHTHTPDKAYTKSLIQENSWTCVFLPIAASFLLGFSPVFSPKKNIKINKGFNFKLRIPDLSLQKNSSKKSLFSVVARKTHMQHTYVHP